MKMANANILVTGGAGFIGSNLVDALVAAGNRVSVLDNFVSGKQENLSHHAGNKNVTVVEGDVRDRDLLVKLTKGVDIVYHLAVQCLRVSIKNPVINHEVNTTGTLNLCMASLENKVKRFVYISSSESYGTASQVPMPESHPLNAITIYGATKAAGELYTLAYYRTYGLQGMIVRPFNTYGPRSHFEGAYGEVIPKFVLRLLNDVAPVIFDDGSQTRDFTYVSDTVRGIIMASECDAMVGQAVNIARGVEVSVKTLLDVIGKILKKEHIKPQYEAPRPGDVKRHYADVRKARELFGYQATLDIKTGVEKYIHWFLSQGYDYKKLLSQDVVFNWESA